MHCSPQSLLSLLLLSPSVSLPPLSLCRSLPAQGCFLSISLPPFLVFSYLSLPCSAPSRPICYLPAGSVLRCTAVGLVRIQAGWVTHSQSAALKPCRRQPHPRTPLLSTDTHGRTSMCAHMHTFTLHSLFCEEWNACKCTHTYMN